MYFVTFTRKLGTNGSEIARRVADELHYNLYDTEAIENTAREMGFLNDVKAVDEKVPSIFERIFSHRSEIYLDRLNSVIYELASRGNAVFLGRGSHVLLKNLNCALSVRVIASLERRIKNMEGRAFGREEAIKAIHRSDSQRGAFIKFAFGVDWENPELYDVALKLDNGAIESLKVCVTGIASSPVVITGIEEKVKGRPVNDEAAREVARLAFAGVHPLANLEGEPATRRSMVRIMTEDLVASFGE